MKKALRAITLFMLVTVMPFLFTGCSEPESVVDGDITLAGNIKIVPYPATAPNTELTAVYDGIENVDYQWKKDSTNVGENFFKFTPTEEGIYTVTVGLEGYKTKTSASVTVIEGGVLIDLKGTITISPVTDKIGTKLTATYSGNEAVAYQWKRNGTVIGANSTFFTADTPGYYTVTVGGFGYNPKTSNTASIFRPNGATPIITNFYTADPSARVFDGRLYLYPSRDNPPGVSQDYSKMDKYRVYSTDNMVDWIDHGEILRRDNLPLSDAPGDATDGEWGPQYTDAMFMWGPDAAFRDSKYYFYFPHALGGISTTPTWENTWTIGVVQSDEPYGGFDGSEALRLKDSDDNYIFGGKGFIDPCIFQDDDDYYLMLGGNGEFRIAKLDDDMVSLVGPLTQYATMTELRYFKEAPWMFKRGAIYYLMYTGNSSGGNGGDELHYATSSSPAGPWAYKGIILDPVGTGDTSHGSIVEFNSKWYLFYHNARLSGGNGALRSVCVEELTFDGDTIRKAVQTSVAVAQNGPNLNTGTLNSKFGTGNYSVQEKYSEGESGKNVGITLLKTIGASDISVLVGGSNGPNDPNGALKQTNDFAAGAIHYLDRTGAYADFTQISGGTYGGRAVIRISYARGSGDNPIQVSVNGGAAVSLPTPITGGWSTAADSTTLEITLNSGNTNTIRFSGAGINIVSLSIYGESE